MNSRMKSEMCPFKWQLLSSTLLRNCLFRSTRWFSLDKILRREGSYESYWAVFSCGTVHLLHKVVLTFDKHKSNCKMPTGTRLPPQYLKWWVLKFRLGTHVPTPRGPRWMEWRIQGRGLGSPAPPLIFRPNKNFFEDQAPPLSKGSGWPGPPLAQGLDPALGCPVSKLWFLFDIRRG